MKKLKVLDLFSGIGGFTLALDKLGGFETVAFCEIDKNCRDVLRKHWPDVPQFTDIKNLKSDEKGIISRKNIDVIVGGFPCQDISVAGKQRGLEDDFGFKTRSGLWFEYKRLIEELQPSYVIIENVANLRSNGLVRVLQDLWSIGYDAEWNIISAREIGACHLRERIWIIAYPNSERLRKQSGRSIGENWKGSSLLGEHGEEWNASNSDSERLQRHIHESGKDESMGGEKEGRSSDCSLLSLPRKKLSPNTDDLRLWRSFTSEEEKCEWWAKTTASERDWWEIESPICRMDDAISSGLHENESSRKQRVKQLGNSIVSGIVVIIGKAILEFEKYKESLELL